MIYTDWTTEHLQRKHPAFREIALPCGCPGRSYLTRRTVGLECQQHLTSVWIPTDDRPHMHQLLGIGEDER